MAAADNTRAAVARRARYRCEYCGYPEAASSTPLEVDHIVPEARGGTTAFSNLALCCRGCNLHKHVKTEAVDPVTGAWSACSTRARSNGLSTLRWTATQAK